MLGRGGDDLGGGIPVADLGRGGAAGRAQPRGGLLGDPGMGREGLLEILAFASMTCRYIVGAMPVCHGWTTSATLTTWMGSAAKIGQRGDHQFGVRGRRRAVGRVEDPPDLRLSRHEHRARGMVDDLR